MSMTQVRPLGGIIPPVITPLRDVDQLDVAALERLIEHIVAHAVGGLFILGSCGEAASLTASLRCEMVRETCRIVAGRVPVLVGITHNVPCESIQLARFAADAGADAVVTSTPSYFKLDQQELILHIESLLPELPLPVLLYNIPQLTGVSFTPETVACLMQHDCIIGIKDSASDMSLFHMFIAQAQERSDWTVLMGNELLLAEAMLFGAHGGVPGGANVIPHVFVQLGEAAQRGDLSAVQALQRQVADFSQIYTNGQGGSAIVAAIKCACHELGLCDQVLAPPLQPLTGEQQRRIAEVVRRMTQPIEEPILSLGSNVQEWLSTAGQIRKTAASAAAVPVSQTPSRST